MGFIGIERLRQMATERKFEKVIFDNGEYAWVKNLDADDKNFIAKNTFKMQQEKDKIEYQTALFDNDILVMLLTSVDDTEAHNLLYPMIKNSRTDLNTAYNSVKTISSNYFEKIAEAVKNISYSNVEKEKNLLLTDAS